MRNFDILLNINDFVINANMMFGFLVTKDSNVQFPSSLCQMIEETPDLYKASKDGNYTEQMLNGIYSVTIITSTR